ncbi:hypothetical protein D3C83_81080 [compost metagenome]
MGDGEPDLLLTFQIVGGRTAFQIDGAVGHQRNAGGGGDRIELDVDFGHLQLGLHGVDDAQAQVDRVTDRLLLVVVV